MSYRGSVVLYYEELERWPHMDTDQLYQWLEAQGFPGDVIQSFRGNVGRIDRFTF